MNNATSYHADCTIYTNARRPKTPEEIVLCLDFKHLTFGKAKSLSLINPREKEATDIWNVIAGRLIMELPKVNDVFCSISRLSANDDYAIELVMMPHHVANATRALKERLAIYGITVNTFTGVLR